MQIRNSVKKIEFNLGLIMNYKIVLVIRYLFRIGLSDFRVALSLLYHQSASFVISTST